MPVPNLQPAAGELAELIKAVPDDMLARATPCPGYSLGDLIEHVGGLALAFAAAAAKNIGPLTGPARSWDAARLGPDWRTSIPRDLAALAAAWQGPSAWAGQTQAGGVDLPGEAAGMFGLNELVVHGWDLARASGQRLHPEPDALAAVHGFLVQVRAGDPGGDGPFGPVVAVPAGRSLLDQVVGLAGRDPDWRPPASAPGGGGR
jgi:uncharacterized protein (TIGR03086 family)